MADKNLKFTLDFIAKTAGLKDSAQLAEKLGAKLDDSSDSADALAKVMAATADKLEAEMKETAQIAELLGNALGPEMAAKIGQSKIDTIAGEFRAAGLDAKGAEEKIDQLADGVRRLDQVADAAGTLDTKIKDVGKSTDQSRSVMANFTGNAMQELPGMTGMFGPLNMAIGQFGEYAAEGGIKLGQMAKMVGPMLVVAGVIQQIAKAAEEAAKRTEDMRKAQKAFSDGSFDEAAKSLTTAYSSLYGELAKLGVGSDTVTRAILGQKDAQDEVLQATTRAGAANVGLQDRYMELNTILGHAQDAWVEQGVALDVNAERQGVVTATLTKLYGATDAAAAATVRMSGDTRDAKDAMTGLAGEVAGATREIETLKGEIDDQQAWLNMLDTLDDYKLKMNDATASDREKERAGLAVQEELVGRLEAIENLPPEKTTEILTLIDQEKYDEAAWAIGVLTAERTIKLKFGQIGNLPHLPGQQLASGTNSARAGITLVGEQGPELVRFGGGERVSTADETKSLMDPVAFANVVGPMIARAIRQELRSA